MKWLATPTYGFTFKLSSLHKTISQRSISEISNTSDFQIDLHFDEWCLFFNDTGWKMYYTKCRIDGRAEKKKIILQFNLPTATYCMRTPMDQPRVQITF